MAKTQRRKFRNLQWPTIMCDLWS